MDKDKILDVMRNYTFYTSGKFSSKIVASYHQYYGVTSTIGQVDKAMSDDKREGIGKGGIF